MPSTSAAQHRAMEAAAHGRSTLGIPKKVGEEFVAADAGDRHAAGVVHVAPDGQILLLKRAGVEGVDNYVGHWALPGGGGEGHESPEETADRETREELGNTAPEGKLKPLDKRSTPNGMVFHTFAKPVDRKFWPRLNDEHDGAGWFSPDQLPKPMHPAVRATIEHQLGIGAAGGDLDDEDRAALHQNFAAWARDDDDQAQDARMVLDVDDDEDQLRKLLEYIGKNASGGHSFPVIVDPDDRELTKKFYIDGDGAFRIRDIKVLEEVLDAEDQAPSSTTPNSGVPRGKVAEDAVHAACGGRGCKTCGWSGVANTNYWPMKPGLGAMDAAELEQLLAGDEEWEEGKHPRADNGQFGSGGGGTKTTKSSTGKSDTTKSSPKPALSMSQLQKKGGKLGSNEGGLYEGGKGEKFYIKKPGTKAHVKNERQAAALYQLAGAKTLDYRDVEGGEHVATEWKQLEKKNISEFTPAERKEAAKDFAIHAWLSNWDAAGTGGDNQGVLEGKTTTLDVGGSLRYRAQGGPKGGAFGDKVNEFDTMRDKGMSPDAARLFAPMTKDELRASVERVTAIPDDKIRETVGGDEDLAKTLIARKKDLAQRVGLAHDQAIEFNDDLELAFDRALSGLMVDRHGLAFDRAAASVRSESPDGHMHVEVSNISKATVNPYRGDEIPNGRALGLNPDKVYYLLRDPEELKKAAKTFNNLPLLDEHVPVTAANHKPEHVIGSTGTDAAFDGKYLKNSLVVWTDKGIKAIKSNKKKELSSAYRYRADMTSGTHEGVRYDGVMREIVGNHVALVEDGRAGPDVVVGDSRNPKIPKEKFVMSKKVLLSSTATLLQGALMVHLQPKLAMDSKLDLTRGLKNITAKNFAVKKPVLSAWLIESLKGKLAPKFAQDGSIKAGLDAVLDMIEGMPKKAEDEDKNEEEEDNEHDGETAEDEMDDEDADMAGDEDEETPEEKEKRLKAAKDKKAKDAEMKKKAMDEEKEKEKKAMDSAIKAGIDEGMKAERARTEAIAAAKEVVRPRVGALNMAFDSAAGVYVKAFEIVGKKPPKTDDAAMLKFAFDNLPSPQSGHVQTYAQDSSATTAQVDQVRPGLSKLLDRIGAA